MSNSPQTKSPDPKQPTPTSTPTANNTSGNSTAPAQNTATPKTTPSTTTASATETKTEKTPEVKFTTDKIGQWKSAQENPFAAQNRKDAAKKAKREATVRKVFPISLITSLALLSAALIFCVVMLIINIANNPATDDGEDYSTPIIAGNTDADIAKYRDTLQKFYNRNPSATDSERVEEVDRAVQETLSTPNGETYSDAVKLAQMGFCIMNACYDQIISTAGTVNVNNFTEVQKIQYYNILANAYYLTGNTEMAEKYFSIEIN